MNSIECVKQKIRARIAGSKVPEDPPHAENTLEWLLTLNFRVLATNGYIDVFEKPALSQALSDLTGKDLGEDPKAWLEWYRNAQREARKNKQNK